VLERRSKRGGAAQPERRGHVRLGVLRRWTRVIRPRRPRACACGAGMRELHAISLEAHAARRLPRARTRRPPRCCPPAPGVMWSKTGKEGVTTFQRRGESDGWCTPLCFQLFPRVWNLNLASPARPHPCIGSLSHLHDEAAHPAGDWGGFICFYVPVSLRETWWEKLQCTELFSWQISFVSLSLFFWHVIGSANNIRYLKLIAS
jgi:hypothetical protein